MFALKHADEPAGVLERDRCALAGMGLYATESYQSILGATNELTTMIELSRNAKPVGITKPRRAP